jgi:DUF1680 family protein
MANQIRVGVSMEVFLGMAAVCLGVGSVAGAEVVEARGKAVVRAFDLRDVRVTGGPFRAAMERNGEYLLGLEADRFLHYFRTEAGLAARAPGYPGWESAETGAGRCLGHYLSALSLQYRASGDERFRKRLDYIVDELAAVQAVNGNGYVGAEANGKNFWAELGGGNAEALKKFRVPWYVQHKMFAGMRDAYLLAGNEKAKAVLVGMSDWAVKETEKLDEVGFQSMLEQEHGGMREVLCDVYAITGDEKYLKLAARFFHRKVMDPLMKGRDELDGLHANTQIPKAIGEARWYEATGEAEHQKAARFFWDCVVHTHTYANGGNSDRERFGEPGKLSLGNTTSETCNTYNMLKLTGHLFEWEPRVEYVDYVERALYNHILASGGPAPGNFTYYVPMKSGHYRTYSEPEGSFWCCVGTGMENHTKYAQSIFHHDDHALYVNLFIPSELNWDGMIVRQETDYPGSGGVRFALSGNVREGLVLRVRYPGWAGKSMTVNVNGEAVTVKESPGEYVAIVRQWRKGDRVDVHVPMGLRTEALAGSTDRVAVFYGPVLLCGQLGAVEAGKELLKESPASGGEDEKVPALMTKGRSVEQWVVREPGAGLRFRTRDVGLREDVELVPFYERTGRRYLVYWQASQ